MPEIGNIRRIRSSLWTVFFNLALISVQPGIAKANQVAGIEFTYDCPNANFFNFQVRIFRDCSGTNLPDSANLFLKSPVCGVLHVQLVKTGASNITPLCFSALNLSTCNGGSTYSGIQEYIYIGNFFLSGGNALCYDWEAEFSICCRANTIDNIAGPASTVAFFKCPFRPEAAPENNSPQFHSPAVLYACEGQAVCYNPGATDPDGDSLAFELIPALSYNGASVNYFAPFTGWYPLKTTTGIVDFDSTTGSICFIPDSAMTTSVRYRVKEYRCGTYIGFVDREIRIDVLNCNTYMPIVAGGGYNSVSKGIALDTNSFTVIPGDTLAFQLVATDQNSGDTIRMIPDPLTFPAGAFWLVSGNNPATASFFWDTQPADSGYYSFTLTVTDSTCPAYRISIYYFEIFVGIPAFPPPPSLASLVSPPSGFNFSSAAINLSISSGLPPYSFQWSGGDTVEDLSGIPGGLYSVIVTDKRGCFALDTVDIPICYASATLGSDTTVCTGSLAIAATPGMSSYFWCSGQTTQSVTAVGPGQYCVTVTDSLSCMDADTMNLNFGTAPTVDIGNDTTVCENSGFALDAGIGWTGYLWSDSSSSPLFTPPSSGLYHITVSDTNGCLATDSIIINMLQAPAANFSFSANGMTVSFVDLSPGAVSWYWTFGDGDSSSSQNPSYTYLAAGAYSACLQITDSNGCFGDTCQWLAVVGTEEKMNTGITVWPVPADKSVYFELHHRLISRLSLKVLDATGRWVQDLEFPAGGIREEWNTAALPSGIYWLIAEYGNQRWFNKLEIRH